MRDWAVSEALPLGIGILVAGDGGSIRAIQLPAIWFPSTCGNANRSDTLVGNLHWLSRLCSREKVHLR